MSASWFVLQAFQYIDHLILSCSPFVGLGKKKRQVKMNSPFSGMQETTFLAECLQLLRKVVKASQNCVRAAQPATLNHLVQVDVLVKRPKSFQIVVQIALNFDVDR